MSTCISSATEPEGPGAPPDFDVSQPGSSNLVGGQQQHEGGGRAVPLGSVHSMRLLHDVQELPGPHGAYARHLMSFLQRRWWAQVRSRVPNCFIQGEDEGGLASSCQGRVCPRPFPLDSGICLDDGDFALPELLGSFSVPHSPPTAARDIRPLPPLIMETGGKGLIRGRLASYGGDPEGQCPRRPRPFYLFRSASCPGKLLDAKGTAAATPRRRGGCCPPLFHSPKERRDPERSGRSKKEQLQQQQQQQQRQQGGQQGQQQRETESEGQMDDALLRKKLWTLGSLPDHAMVVKRPSQVGRLSSCIFPSSESPRVQGEHEGREKSQPTGIKVIASCFRVHTDGSIARVVNVPIYIIYITYIIYIYYILYIY